MKKLIIKNRGTTSPTVFHVADFEPVECAFDMSRVCSPNCAACLIAGDKVYCNRGVKDDFCIGRLSE